MGSENDPGSRKISRREFVIGSSAFLVGTGIAAVTGNLPRINFNEQPFKEYDDKFLEARNKYPYTRFYYHNGANNPERFKNALASPALNIEADVVNFDGVLFVAHTLPEFIKDLKMHPEYMEIQRADYVFRKIVESGKNPAIDIKINLQDDKGFSLLINSIADIIPEDRIVTFSGNKELAKEFTFRPNSIVVPTVGKSWQIPEYKKYAERNWKNIDPNLVRVGATVDSDFWDDDLQDLIGFNTSRGFETNVYTVNSESRIITLLNWGATGITSDEESIISRATMK